MSRYADTFVREGSNRPIARGQLDPGSPYYVMAQNANNHQITYGVLGKALQAMADWMFLNGDALVKYEVWDGDDMVGRGLVGKETGWVRLVWAGARLRLKLEVESRHGYGVWWQSYVIHLTHILEGIGTM